MSVFDEFVSLYMRFRLAAEYNGHLWHHLIKRTRNKKDITEKHAIALLQELRMRLLRDEHACEAIDQLISEVVSQADSHRPKAGGGKTPEIVTCPWCLAPAATPANRGDREEGWPGPSIVDTARDCRRGFTQGMQALLKLLDMIDAVGIARGRILSCRSRIPDSDIQEYGLDDLALDVVLDGRFTDGCLSPATLSHLDLYLLVLLSCHPTSSEIRLNDIRAMVRSGTYTIRQPGISLGGRFASIANTVLVARYGRPKKKKNDNGNDNRQSDVREVSRPNIEIPCFDQGPLLVDCWDRVDVTVQRSRPEHQSALRYYAERAFEDGEEDAEIYIELSEKFGMTRNRARTICTQFRERLFYRDLP